MSHLSSPKGEKRQHQYAENQASFRYASDLYTRAQSNRENSTNKELEERPPAREYAPMNPSSASATAIYPRVGSRTTVSPTHFEGFGIPSRLPTSSGHSSYRHLLPHHNLQFGPSHAGLDAMWQQKMNPNSWVLSHYEEMRMERERTMAQERMAHEKERNMAQERMIHEKERNMAQERMIHEKERNMAQERMIHEKERNMAQERMIHEKERSMAQERERERTIMHEKERSVVYEREHSIIHERDPERIDKQKDDRNEKDRQREWQDLDREERERAQSAVQQHFEASLRLALQKKSWNPSSSGKSIVKNQEGSHSVNFHSSPGVRSTENDRLREQEKERATFIDNNHARREHERWLAMVQQQRSEQPANVSLHQSYTGVEGRSGRGISKSEAAQMTAHGSSKSNLVLSPVSSTSQMKNETNFSLYGYQPFQHTYITHAQLKAREETKPGSSHSIRMPVSGHLKTNLPPMKGEKEGYHERSLLQSSSHLSNPSIAKAQGKTVHPSQERGNLMYQPLVGSGGAFKPYEYSSNSSSPAPPAHQNTSPAVVGRVGSSHYQLQDLPQNLVKSDGKGMPEKIITSHKYDARDSKLAVCASSSLPSRFSPPYASSKSTSPAANTTYSYSLIQQGLVPNPMYIAAGSSGSSSTLPVSFAHSHSSSKTLTRRSPSRSSSPQNSRASPNSAVSSSVPYSHSLGRISRSYSPVGSVPGLPSTGKISAQDTSLSNRTHISLSARRSPPSARRSPSPAHIYGTTSNPGSSNSPHQSSPRLTPMTSHLPIIKLSSPYHSNSQAENLEASGIPLVKRKLLNDITSRKRPKSDDGLYPPQLQPQIQTPVESDEIEPVNPPHLLSSVPIISDQQNNDSQTRKSNPSSPSNANLAYKQESLTMPDLHNILPIIHIEPPPDEEHSNDSQNCYSGLGKYKLPTKSNQTFDITQDNSGNNQSDNASDKTNQSLSNSCDEQFGNTSYITNSSSTNLTPSNGKVENKNSGFSNATTSSSCHPKLKKAWLQRHSENEDKKVPPEIYSHNSNENLLHSIQSESKATSENIKSEPYTDNYTCDQYGEESKIIPNEDDTSDAESKSLKIDVTAEDDSLSSESDSEFITKNEKRKSKSKSKTPITFKRTKINDDDDVSSPKKEKDLKKKNYSLEKDMSNRKRGRKNKGRNVIIDETSKKKETPKTVPPSEKPSIQQLKKTGEAFLQDGPCCEVAPRLPKCRECRMTPHQRSKKMPNIFCRFYAFRKLRYGKNGTILSAGFSEPSDAADEDLKLWLPPIGSPPADIEIETSKFLLTHIGDQFCDLVEMEKEAQKLHMSIDSTITWKRVVQGVREMCDVCEATLFNIHWVCHKCGFVVCIDCYKSRKNGLPKDETTSKDRDDFQWLLCSNRQPHEQDKLMLTQIIAGTALWDVGKALHEIRQKWNIPTYCNCGLYDNKQDSKSSTNGICKLMSAVTKCFSSDKDSSREANGSSDFHRSNKKTKNSSVNGMIKSEDGVGGYSSESGGSPLSWLADVALNSTKTSEDQKERDDEEKLSEDQESNADVESDDDKNENFSTLRELLIRPTGKMGGKNNSGSSTQKTLTSTLDEVISCVIEQKVRKGDKKYNEKQLFHFTRRHQMPKSGRELPPVRTCMLSETSLLYPDIPHSWLGNGKILLLKDPYHLGNMQMFQEQWKRGQPVIIADVGKKMDPSLWTPESFIKDFGDFKSDFLNCLCNTVLQNQPMKKFWEGFDNIGRRIKDEDGESLVLKLMNWPATEEFSEILPTRYEDLMKALPLPQYTHREGVLNMASRLPECFVQPDLGPKMYNAYGVSSSLGKGSTNLHLDISDSINILAHVAIPYEEKDDAEPDLHKALDDCGCDSLMKKRAKGSEPGAVWHVYNARDADKIRDFLNKVSEEQGVKLNPHHDPIHNQEWYLDEKLRHRLYKEYCVEPYTIAQCHGDAIFIPAGSPHQVLNMYSCIKVSEDFVSPESVGHSFFLTQEIRNMSDAVVNNEDRLQIKNVIYHTVKDALALLQSHDPKEVKS